jgi:hypothetical protein
MRICIYHALLYALLCGLQAFRGKTFQNWLFPDDLSSRFAPPPEIVLLELAKHTLVPAAAFDLTNAV